MLRRLFWYLHAPPDDFSPHITLQRPPLLDLAREKAGREEAKPAHSLPCGFRCPAAPPCWRSQRRAMLPSPHGKGFGFAVCRKSQVPTSKSLPSCGFWAALSLAAEPGQQESLLHVSGNHAGFKRVLLISHIGQFLLLRLSFTLFLPPKVIAPLIQ